MASHKQRFGRLDVLVNNAGVGIGGGLDAVQAKHLDMQLSVNLRSYVLATREAIPMLKEAGAEHGKALIINTASVAGKNGQGWLGVYSATKFGVVGLSQATQMELGSVGCPGDCVLPRVRRHADDGVGARPGKARGDDPAERPR